MNNIPLSSIEKKSISSLAAVYGLRMFGLFLILPVLAIHAEQLQGATPVLMGMALGIYGMTQALLQIPFGMLSDRYGRKPLIIIGLLIFASGGLVAAASDTILGVIIGRALQGAGAVAAVVLAMVSDLTRENQRTKAMAFIGMSIGMSFLLALIIAPTLEFYIGVKGLFVLTSILALASIVLIVKVIPTPVQKANLEVKAVPQKMTALLKHRQLIRLDMGIFILHFVLTAMFVVIPIILVQKMGLAVQAHWKVYVPALIISILLMIPLIILSSKPEWVLRIFLAAVCIVLFSQCLLMWRPFGYVGIVVCMVVFFLGFNLLESILPSLVSRVAPAAGKGSAMGVYNTFQFLGVFFGGLIGGMVYGMAGVTAVFVVSSLALLFWAYLIYSAPEMHLLDSITIAIAENFSVDKVRAIEGVEEVVCFTKEKVAYLKVDKARLDLEKLASYQS